MGQKNPKSRLNQFFEVRDSPFLIAGPCSAESETQVMDTAQLLVENTPLSVFRAGVWKPRTRPGSFEGIGAHALPWLANVKKTFNLPVAIEIANAKQVEMALKADIDVLWLGARTTVNPFYVTEIADALSGTDKVVMVKNPLHPEIGLWAGAFERLAKAGIEKTIAVHRGFFTTENAPFRNDPRWELSFEFRGLFPEVPLLCDPSHIAGRADLIGNIAQTALDLNVDGLMVEAHVQPEKALSDAKQQLTPQNLGQLYKDLRTRQVKVGESQTEDQLKSIRQQINQMDAELIEVLARRFQLVDEIGNLKTEKGITVFQLERWFEILKQRKSQGLDLGLEEKLITELFSVIHKYSVSRQTQITQQIPE